MKKSGRSYLIDNLIINYKKNNIRYVFLRIKDFENLKPTEDLDIVIDESSVEINEIIMKEITKSDEFILIKNFKFNDNIVYTIFINESNYIDVLHIHFQINLRVKQVSIDINNSIYLANKVIMNNYINVNGFNILNDEHYLYSIIMHSIFDKGYFKQEYISKINDLTTNVSMETLEKVFAYNFPGSFSSEVLKLIYNKEYDKLISNKNELFKLSFGIKTRIMFLINNLRRLCINISRIWSNKGVFVVLLGPDGSGKTTVAKKIIESINYSRKEYIYLGSNKKRILPYPNINRKHKNRENSSCISIDTMLRFRIKKRAHDYLRLLYNTFEYLLHYNLKVYPLLTKNYLVIGDRYFYDILTMKDSTLKPSIEKIVLKIFPRPSCTILLDNNPATIKDRKDELTEEEISRLLLKYKDLGILNPKINMKEVMNENIEETLKIVLQAIWKIKSNKQYSKKKR